jgi:type I restriction enzyme S subunit
MKKLHRWQTPTIGGGSGFPETYQDNSAGDLPFIKVSDLNLPGNEKHVVIANNWITEDVRKKIRAKVQPSGAIVFAKVRGALLTNKRRILTRPTIIDNNMMSLMATDTHPGYF